MNDAWQRSARTVTTNPAVPGVEDEVLAGGEGLQHHEGGQQSTRIAAASGKRCGRSSGDAHPRPAGWFRALSS